MNARVLHGGQIMGCECGSVCCFPLSPAAADQLWGRGVNLLPFCRLHDVMTSHLAAL